MRVKIKKGRAAGSVDAPPSKSMAHRMLICAGLCRGTSVIHGIAESEDVLATIDCLEVIGAKCVRNGDSVTVTGTDLRSLSGKTLRCRESGSTLRFFAPICLISGSNTVLSGSPRLLHRPLGVYENLCKEKGLLFSQDDSSVVVKGPLKAGNFKVAGNVSSQFISGLLFALPLIEGDSVIHITPPIESRPYIDMTISALACFGVKARWKDENTLCVPGGQQYRASEVQVEGDYSNAAFFEALNLFGGDVKITNLSADSIQGDRAYSQMFKRLENGIPIINVSDCPDLGPVLFAAAAAKNGGVFLGTARLEMKESNRGEVMTEELKKFGVSSKIYEDETVIYPAVFKKPEEALSGHNDHRIVMSEAVLLTLTGGVIDGAEAVAKSFPDFFDKLKILGIEVEEIED